MGKVNITDAIANGPNVPGSVHRLVNLTVSAWHAAFPSGGAVNVSTAFSNPSSAEADRIPELALAGGGTPGSYVITGTWNGAAQTETIGPTVAGATVKGTLPFDTVTLVTGPDPGANLTLNQGDSYADPPARALWTAGGGAVNVQLAGESSAKTVSGLPAGIDWWRRVRRIGATGTGSTIAGMYLMW